jgi:GR25 family glycosyltransferase involved in LPS biosynthesis
VNPTSFPDPVARLHYWITLRTRFLDRDRESASFAASLDDDDVIQRIYVINLDRQPSRWRQVSRELGSLRERSGKPLTLISRRFSAVDARYRQGLPDPAILAPHYSLHDQLSVAPSPKLDNDGRARERQIDITPQEVAVALSHVAIWKLIAASRIPFTLVLEDDVYFRHGCVRNIDSAWGTLMERSVEKPPVDLLYLSFKEAGETPRSRRPSDELRRPDAGLWQLSGYVLSCAGAQKLLDRLPARGPIDLWVNLQFGELNVFATGQSIIEQRPDLPSTNSYSVLPILSQLGVLTREKPLVVRDRALAGPVFGVGEAESGLTSLATALGILGYRCCSDISELPAREGRRLVTKKGNRAFNAYVNVGSLGSLEVAELARLYGSARFIVTARAESAEDGCGPGQRCESSCRPTRDMGKGSASELYYQLSRLAPHRTLLLPLQCQDKWELLSSFLGCDYPPVFYPDRPELGQRRLLDRVGMVEMPSRLERRLKFDSSPWIIPLASWRGISVAEVPRQSRSAAAATWNKGEQLDEDRWVLRDDTFPSNLALFMPENCSRDTDGLAKLTLREQRTSVRLFTSAAIASRRTFLYGRFAAELRPPSLRGLITGMFLHRNGPRQEIDMEILGRDTRKLLVNVYYNPGDEGAGLEFGYRGTPVLIDLGFDAAKDIHRYEIEWSPQFIRWRVDERLVHERVLWDPTPIPDLPMQFNINLWNSRSRELAGKLDVGRLPAHTEVNGIFLT